MLLYLEGKKNTLLQCPHFLGVENYENYSIEHQAAHFSLNNPPVTGFPHTPMCFPVVFQLILPRDCTESHRQFYPPAPATFLRFFFSFSLSLYDLTLLYLYSSTPLQGLLCAASAYLLRVSWFPTKPFSARSSACESLASLLSLPQAATQALPPTFFSPPTFYSLPNLFLITECAVPLQCGSFKASYERSSSPFLPWGRR